MAWRFLLTQLLLAASAEDVCRAGCDEVSMIQNEVKKAEIKQHAIHQHSKTGQGKTSQATAEHVTSMANTFHKGANDAKTIHQHKTSQGKCETATGGTCNVWPCNDNRGPTNCNMGWSGYYCACKEENYCANEDGECVPNGCLNVDSSHAEYSECYGHIRWAKDVGLKQNPVWYNGTALTTEAPDKVFQYDFWKNHPGHKCPPPCVPTPMNK
mmetsp:Transcript_27290/g.49402  ORF Transcript_27290/g.49402 Transcript_27290/m.49402 type:complete len:212 (-) Transcript_27290:157-792(-)